MAQPAAILSVLVTANTKQASHNLTKLHGRLVSTDAQTKTLGSSMKAMGRTAGLAAGAAGLGALIFGTKKAFTEFREAEKVTNQTKAALKSTGNQAKITAKEIENLAEAISYKAGIDDEAIQSGENLLLTFTNIRNEAGKGNKIFSEATKTIVDMSVALDQDLKGSAIQVGKALQDPEKGITALRRVGVNFTDTQKDMITKWVEHGKTLKAQKFILRELNTEFGGSAAAQADNVDKLKVAWDNMFESIGKSIGPWLERAMGNVAKFIRQMENGKGAGGEFARTMKGVFKVVGDVFHETFVSFRHFVQWLSNAIHNLDRFGDGARHVIFAIARWFEDTFNNIKRIFGNVMAFIYRGFAKLFDVASHLPGIGAKFGRLRDQANAFAEEADRAGEKTKWLGQQIRKLPTKKQIQIEVDLALADLSAGNVPKLTPFPGRPGTGDPGIEEYIEGKVRARAKNLNPLAALGGGVGIVAVGRLLQGMGYHVGEHPSFGGVQGGHVPGSYHYRGRAIDVNADDFPGGEPRALDAIYPLLAKIPHAELLWRTKGHYDHLHFAMAKGGKVNKSGIQLVGEEGPELVSMPVGTEVFSHSKSKAMVARMGGMFPGFAKGGEVGDVSKELRRLIIMAAKKYGIPARILAGLIKIESGWDPNAVSSAGAFGLTQFMPATATGYAVKSGSGHAAMASQILGAAHYLKDLGYADDRSKALASYNGGPGNPQYGYARDVIAASAGYRGLGANGGGAEDEDDPPNWNWVTMGDKKRGVFLRGKAKRTLVDAFNFARLARTHKIDWGRSQHQLGDKTALERYNRAAVTRNRKPYGGIGKGGILDAFMQHAADRLNMMEALAALTPDMADDIAVAKDAVGTWETWLNVAKINNIPAGITAAAQNLKSARDRYTELTAPDTSAADAAATAAAELASTRAGLLEQLLREANQRTAVSQAQYGVLRNFGGSFAEGGVIPGPVGSPRVIVAHGGETVTPPGASGGVHLHFAPGTEWLRDFVKVTVDKENRRTGQGAGRGLPGAGGGWH